MKTTRLSPESIKLSSKVTKKPSFPRRASVEKSATISNIIELNRTNLIGIFGTEIKAVALIRLTSGQIIKVKVGDRFEGWQVLSISKDKINLANGRTQETLRLPG
jgi:type IV pilus biogenesis protein PilP